MNIRKNTILMTVYELFIYLIPLITTPYIARVLGTYGNGIYSYTYAIVSYFIVGVQLGVNVYGRREIASKNTIDDRSKTFWSIFLILFFSFIIVTCVYFFIAFLIDAEYRIPLLLQSILLLSSLVDISWFFFGIEDFKTVVIRNILVKLLSLVLIFTLVKTSEDTNLYIFIMSFSTLISVLIMWISLRKKVKFVSLKKAEIIYHIKPLLVMTIPVVSIQLFSLTDKLFLGIMGQIDSVGIYENVYRISRVPVAIITTLGTVLLPRITNMLANGEEQKTYDYIDKSLKLTMMISSACAFGLISIAPQFVVVYLGEEYSTGIVVLQILSLILLPLGWGNVFRTQFILPRKMDKIYIISVVASAIINIILNLVFIPLWGINGAAIASFISELSICIYQTVIIRKQFKFKKMFLENLIYIFAGIAMCALVYLFGLVFGDYSIKTIIIQLLIGVFSYFILIVIYELLTKKKLLLSEVETVLRKIKK